MHPCVQFLDALLELRPLPELMGGVQTENATKPQVKVDTDGQDGSLQLRNGMDPHSSRLKQRTHAVSRSVLDFLGIQLDVEA